MKKTLQLKSGYEMPVLGLGTWQLKGQKCKKAVQDAYELGYRHIDTAEMYENEADIGEAIRKIDRKSLFITSKAPQKYLAHQDLLSSCRRSLEKLGTDYLDLYLLHWPNDDILLDETLEGIRDLFEQGSIRSFGVSNFDVGRIQDVLSKSEVPVSNLQIEYHPFTQRHELPAFCLQEKIVITAYSPLARGKVFENETIKQVAKAHGKNPAQVSLRWLVQKGHVVVPKSSSREHLRDNMDVFDWALTREEMEKIDRLKGERLIDTQYT